MKLQQSTLPLFIAAALSGCSSMPTNMPLIFAESMTVGIGISATAGDQGADFTLGYKSRDVAIIPVTVLKPDGAVEKLIGKEKHNSASDSNKGESEDAYSVIGQFETTTGAEGHQVGLGKFFATGQAAVYLSEGFKSQLGNKGAQPDTGSQPGAAAQTKDATKK